MGRKIGFWGIGLLVYILTLVSFVSDVLQTKTDEFSVMLDDKKIGDLSIVEVRKDSIVGYALVSNVKVSYLISLKIKEKISERYVNGHLVKSRHYRTINGSSKASNHLILKDGKYVIVDSLSNKKSKLMYPVNWSTLSIYFKEPKGVSTLYSQNFRKMLKVTNQGDHLYHVHLPKEKISKYQYKSGKLMYMETEAIYGTLRFERKTE